MKVLSTLIVLLLLLSVSVFAQDWTAEPAYPDFDPHDGILDPGTEFNPYILRDEEGRERGTLKPMYPDLYPDDGILDRGTWSNPYEVEWDE